MYAYQFLARDKAGLILVGQEDDGDLMWDGTFSQWQMVDILEDDILNPVY